MQKVGRNQPCPCGSGVKYKKCCLLREAADRSYEAAGLSPESSVARADPPALAARPASTPEPNIYLGRDPWGDHVVVFDTPYRDALNIDIKRLPGRYFDWRDRVWIVPAEPGVETAVAAILARHPWLRVSRGVDEWLEAGQRFGAQVTVLEVEGRGMFGVAPFRGAVPAVLRDRSEERGSLLLLPLDRSGSVLLGQIEGLTLDEPARACREALNAGRDAPPAILTLGRGTDGELQLELRVLWGFALADRFAALPDVEEGDWRDGDFCFDVQAERLVLPADPALADQVDRLLQAEPATELTAEARTTLERMRADHRRARETVALSRAEDAELELPRLGGELRPFQRAGVRYALSQRRTFLADEQGLGKTVQALATLEADGAFPAVVVCPATMKLTWEREAQTWLPARRVAVVQGRSAAGWHAAAGGETDIVVINYEIVEAQLERLSEREPAAVIFDESHYCKDPRRKRTKAAIELSRRAKPDALRLALTGTPILNRPTELPSQLRLLDQLSAVGSGARLTRRFRGEEGHERLHWHLRAHCYVRRLKADVLPQLPAKRMAIVEAELDNVREYRLAEASVAAWLRTQPLDLRSLEAKVAAALRAERLVRIGYLRRLAADGKLAAAAAWIEDFVTSGEPLVVFAHHRHVQTALCNRFPQAAHVLATDGLAGRRAAVDAFQDPDGPPLIVCSMQAAGQGLTLTRASNVAFVELDWTPAKHDQAEDRCHRIGQESAVTAWYLVAPDTIDQTMSDVLARKRGVIGAVTDGRSTADAEMLAAVVGDLRDKGGERAEMAAA